MQQILDFEDGVEIVLDTMVEHRAIVKYKGFWSTYEEAIKGAFVYRDGVVLPATDESENRIKFSLLTLHALQDTATLEKILSFLRPTEPEGIEIREAVKPWMRDRSNDKRRVEPRIRQ